VKLPQVAEDWLTFLGLVAVGILVNAVLGTALLYVFELLGLSPITGGAADDTLRAVDGATSRPRTGLASPG
jgi:hypothetical protein